MEFGVQNFPTKKILGPDCSSGKFCKIFKKEVIPVLYKVPDN